MDDPNLSEIVSGISEIFSSGPEFTTGDIFWFIVVGGIILLLLILADRSM